MWSLGRALGFLNPGLRSFPPCSGPACLLSVGCSRCGKGDPGPCSVQSGQVAHNWSCSGMAGVACRAAGASCASFEWVQVRYGRVGLPLQAWLVPLRLAFVPILTSTCVWSLRRQEVPTWRLFRPCGLRPCGLRRFVRTGAWFLYVGWHRLRTTVHSSVEK